MSKVTPDAIPVTPEVTSGAAGVSLVAAKRPTRRGGCRPLSHDEVTKVEWFATTPEHHVPLTDQLFFSASMDTGLRAEEVRCLTFGMFVANGKWKRFVLIPGRLCKGKYAPDRLIEISAHTLKLLKEQAKVARSLNRWGLDKFIFFTAKSHPTRPLSYSCLRGRLTNLFERALPNPHRLSTHTPRKTLATAIWRETGDIFLVKQTLGHRQLSSTIKYIELTDADANAARATVRERREKAGRPLVARLNAAKKTGQLHLDFIDDDQSSAATTLAEVVTLPLSPEERTRRNSAAALAAAEAERERTRQILAARRHARSLPAPTSPPTFSWASDPPWPDPAEEALAACA